MKLEHGASVSSSGAGTGGTTFCSGAGTPIQLPLVMELEPGAITSGNGVEPNATASGSGAGTWCIYCTFDSGPGT